MMKKNIIVPKETNLKETKSLSCKKLDWTHPAYISISDNKIPELNELPLVKHENGKQSPKLKVTWPYDPET